METQNSRLYTVKITGTLKINHSWNIKILNEEQTENCNIMDKEETIINHMRDSGKKHFYLGKSKICMPKKKKTLVERGVF